MSKPDSQTGKPVEYVRYFVMEDGEKKVYDTKLRDKEGGLSYLVQRLAEVNEGDELILEMKKQGIKNYVEVTPIGHSSTVYIDEEDEEEADDEETVIIQEPEPEF